MKKPFNIDTINTRFDENRQDRLRQKFRQLLGNQNSIQQNNWLADLFIFELFILGSVCDEVSSMFC
jgi:hypothetical protein